MASSTQVRQYRGLALPALRAAGGYFASKSRHDVAFGDLLVALFTPVGTRPMSRGFGSNLSRVVFQPVTADIGDVVEHVVREAANRWAPHVVILGVDVRQDGEKVGILVRFSMAGDSKSAQERPILISKSDVINLLAASKNA